MVAPRRPRVPTGERSRNGTSRIRRRGGTPAEWLVYGAAVTLLGACGAHGDTASASGTTEASPAVHRVQGRAGSLVIADGYVPEPASPDVAAAYLTIVNTGDASSRLTDVHSSAAATVVPMTETSTGGVGSMSPLDRVVVPAHGTFHFRAGAAHLMLERPQPVPAAGDSVALVLTFDPGGTVTVTLPVTPIGATDPTTPQPAG